jgi:SOS-response transcriptional repressor LexA
MVTHAQLIEQGVARREAIMAYIRAYHETRGYPPSMAEIAENQGIAKSAIRHHLYRLQRDGLITMTPNKYRSIRVLS